MDRFNEIKEQYDAYYTSLLKQGRLLAKDTGVGFWGPSVSDEVYAAFKKLKLGNYSNFLDLGSGDGKVAMIAALFCKQATGVEYDSMLTGKAMEMKEKIGVYNAHFINDDFFNHDLSAYDIIFHAPDKPLHRGVEEKLLKEMKGKLVLYGHHFHPTNLRKENEFTVNGTLVSVYTKPRADRSHL